MSKTGTEISSHRQIMTLERLTERLQEEKDKVGKVDGRRFNSRSRTKMTWEMRNIAKSIGLSERKKRYGANRSIFTKEELAEYKLIEEQFRNQKLEAKKEAATSTTTPTEKENTATVESVERVESALVESTPVKI